MTCFDGAWRRQVADLIALVHASDLAELEIEHGSFALRIQRDAHAAPVAPAAAPAAPPHAAAPQEPTVLRSPQESLTIAAPTPIGTTRNQSTT